MLQCVYPATVVMISMVFLSLQNLDESNRTHRITNLLIQFTEHFFAQYLLKQCSAAGEGVRLHFGIVT